ncbi:MAG: hypothetical protein WCR02_08120 [Sphaerochaetaceae bacterium]
MKTYDLLPEFAVAHGDVLTAIIREKLEDHLEKNKDNLQALTRLSIYASVHGLVWDEILKNAEILSDPEIFIITRRNEQQKFMVYKHKLVIALSKTGDDGKVKVSQHSQFARDFDGQENLSFQELDEDQVHAYIYYSTDSTGYEITEVGIQCPTGNGVHFTKVPFYGDIGNQSLMFPCSQDNSPYEELQKLKAKFKKKKTGTSHP